MADDEGVRRRDVLKGLGVTGAVAGIVAKTVSPGIDEAQAQPAAQPHGHTIARNGQAADAFRFFTPPEAAVVVALVDTLIPKDDVGPGGVEVGVPMFVCRWTPRRLRRRASAPRGYFVPPWDVEETDVFRPLVALSQCDLFEQSQPAPQA